MIDVWIADDDADDQLFLQDALTLHVIGGVHIRHFYDGQSVLLKCLLNRKLGLQLPTLLFLNGRMPLMTGVEVLKALHAFKLTRQFPIILLSDSFTDRDRVIITTCGASYYLKPGYASEYLALLQNIFASIGSGYVKESGR